MGVELPILTPMYGTYLFQGPGSAVLAGNPSIRNWYLNEVMILSCNRMFLTGHYSCPEVVVEAAEWKDNPYLEKQSYPMKFLKGHVSTVILNLLDAGYYVYYDGVDDYYVRGKSWYKERHFNHDGLICGYSRENKTYCLFAYDSNWVYQKFWTPQTSFHAGRKALQAKGIYGTVCGIKPKPDIVAFSPMQALGKIAEYLDSTPEKYPENGKGRVFGIMVHDYIAKYIDRLMDGSIPYERIDRRVFRMIWEHKTVMLERIRCIEQAMGLSGGIGDRYAPLAAEAEAMRMLYASHHMKRRDSLLPVIQKKLLALKNTEYILLQQLLVQTGVGEVK